MTLLAQLNTSGKVPGALNFLLLHVGSGVLLLIFFFAQAIGIRGFGSALSRSVLVLIDGRSVYTPLFAGVYWDVQDILFFLSRSITR
jgi:hypothetical protein